MLFSIYILLKTTKNILNELRNLEPIIFYNGLHIGSIDLSKLFFEYVDKDLGKRSFQVFQVYLNNNVTINGANNILKQKSNYEKYLNYFYKELDNNYSEALIFNEFEFFVTEIKRELQIKEQIIQKEIKSLVNHIINNLLKDVNKTINLDILSQSASKDVIEYVEIENYVASELVNFTKNKRKNIIEVTKESLTLEIQKKNKNISKKL